MLIGPNCREIHDIFKNFSPGYNDHLKQIFLERSGSYHFNFRTAYYRSMFTNDLKFSVHQLSTQIQLMWNHQVSDHLCTILGYWIQPTIWARFYCSASLCNVQILQSTVSSNITQIDCYFNAGCIQLTNVHMPHPVLQ